MHVRKRLRIDLDRLAQTGGAVRPAVRDADRIVGKGPVGREALNPTLDVHLFGQFVCSANDLLVAHGKVLSVPSVETSVGSMIHDRRMVQVTPSQTSRTSVFEDVWLHLFALLPKSHFA